MCAQFSVFRAPNTVSVMAGLVPAIHVAPLGRSPRVETKCLPIMHISLFLLEQWRCLRNGVEGRDKPGYDGEGDRTPQKHAYPGAFGPATSATISRLPGYCRGYRRSP